MVNMSNNYPRCTQIIHSVFPFNADVIPDNVLKASQDFGIAVHKTIELYLKGTLNLATLDPILAQYLEQFKKWQKDTKFEVKGFSQRLYSTKRNFTGELDFWGKERNILTIVDIKTTSAISPTTGLQLSGYELLLGEHLKTQARINRRVLKILPDKYYYIPLNNTGDMNVFLSCLCVYNYKKQIKC